MPHDKVFYFAFGSNLNKKDWNSGFRPDFDQCFEKIGVAWLAGHRLAFTRYSGVRQGGVLDIVRQRGGFVPGAVFRIKNHAGWRALSSKEGGAYKPVWIKVRLTSGEIVNAFTFQMRDHLFGGTKQRNASFVEPHDAYIAAVRKGLRNHRLPTRYLEAAIVNKPTPALDAFFCYGTLRSGECRYGVMESLGILSEQRGKVRGRLHDCGSYPAITLDAPQKARVIGERIRVENLAEAKRQLDRIEGYDADRKRDSLYIRKTVSVLLANRENEIAWIYEFNRRLPERVIESGDWFNR